jgi:2-amino-4-hydroxy-6-hydroxymethyldihydropteridine diphosphokinase
MRRYGYIGIGSNLGDRLAALRCAVRSLSQTKAVVVENCSHVVETPPWGFDSKNSFLNVVVHFSTTRLDKDIEELLSSAELACGRDRRSDPGPHYEDREIDLDLIWLEKWEGSGSRLIVPHPRAHQRAFVLLPLEELAEDLELAGYPLSHWIDELEPDDIDALGWRRDLSIWPLN